MNESVNEFPVQLTDVIAAEQEDVVHRSEFDDSLKYYEAEDSSETEEAAHQNVPKVEHLVCDESYEIATDCRSARSNIEERSERFVKTIRLSRSKSKTENIRRSCIR